MCDNCDHHEQQEHEHGHVCVCGRHDEAAAQHVCVCGRHEAEGETKEADLP
ncbi:MAG: hypothetical protein HY340_00260 [Candidatus Kerfeldbacteria bacterium]|nr:hypothetical protein [Candidatus Kerfeldbacteria bacterium]